MKNNKCIEKWQDKRKILGFQGHKLWLGKYTEETNRVRFVREGPFWHHLRHRHKTSPKKGFMAFICQKFLFLVRWGNLWETFMQLLNLKCLQFKVSSIFWGVTFWSPITYMYTCTHTHTHTHIHILTISKGTQFNKIRKHRTMPYPWPRLWFNLYHSY